MNKLMDVCINYYFSVSYKQELVESECQRWASKGVNIKYENRSNRNGYKAGAMCEGLRKSYVRDCEYVAIFDADFQPESDFLWRTIPFLLSNHDLALVQARWKFGEFSNFTLLYIYFLLKINKHNFYTIAKVKIHIFLPCSSFIFFLFQMQSKTGIKLILMNLIFILICAITFTFVGKKKCCFTCSIWEVEFTEVQILQKSDCSLSNNCS